MKKSLLSMALAFGVFAATNLPAHAATYTVTSLADTTATGTLRWAIGQANLNPGSTIAFATSGTITLSSALPTISRPVTIDGTTAPGFAGSPIVSIDFSGQHGLTIGKAANRSLIRALSLVQSGGDGVTIRAANVTIDGNYIGLTPSGAAAGNRGDGVKILATSRDNLIGGTNPITGIKYLDCTNPADFTIQPIATWQGLRNYGTSTSQFLICGTTDSIADGNGLLYVGPISGGGISKKVMFPGSATTSVYGPDNAKNGKLRLVGTYTRAREKAIVNHGFVWEGDLSALPGGGVYRTIDYPGATYQFAHSTMGDLVVGNADGPTSKTKFGPIIAYIYDLKTDKFSNIVFPGSKSNTAYGIWDNGHNKYTICGGYSDIATNNVKNPTLPLARERGFLVDYDSKTGKFSNWKSYRYRNGKRGKSFLTHFEGISSAEPGVYTLVADNAKRGSETPIQGSWVSVRRNPNGTFSAAQWVDLNAGAALNAAGEPNGITSANSVYGNNVVGVVSGSGISTYSFQGIVQVGFSLSNVISGNKGNGVGIYGSKHNVVAQNYIGTNPAGTAAIGNKKNGILLTGKASGNLIGGQEAGANNPTGTELKVTPVYITPPQGNTISGNGINGVLINRASANNLLSGNFIGTDATGDAALGNRLDGVSIENSSGNSLIGCTLRQDPFVFYNVVSGNGRDGVRLTNANDTTVQANFLGISADNQHLIPNAGNGLTVGGSSQDTTVGGVIPLGNVISGNTKNGIAVTGTAAGFISFNTFGGGFAFGDKAPNGLNGVLITSTGGNNVIQTCILSGNLGNGLEIGGNATGVQVMDTACGTTTNIGTALANQGSGVVISGTAHGNALGGFAPSVEGRTHFSGNVGYGVAVIDQAHDNFIFNSNIGTGHIFTSGTEQSIPNQTGGIYLGPGTSGTTIGGTRTILANRINTNTGGGLIIEGSAKNNVVNNVIKLNTEFGIFATGACSGTTITENTTTENGSSAGDNVDISGASGISFTP